MASVDKKFVEKLESFTEALESIVEYLNIELKKDTTDSVDKMIDSMPDKIIQISEDLSVVKGDVKSIKSTTDDIKKTVDQIKKDKKSTGGFEKITETDNKKKIIDGVSVIMVIAGGVLAIGMAFKLIGKIDYLSVLSLSAGVIAISYAFVLVSKSLKDNELSKKDILMTSMVLPVMAIGLIVSSFILKKSPIIDFKTGISLLFVAVTMGSALFLISKALSLSKLKKKDTWKYLLLPLILPSMALGLVASSWILKGSATVGLKQMVTIVGISLAMGVALFLITKALKISKLKKENVGQFLLLPIILPVMALALVASSWVLKGIKSISFKELLSIVALSLAVGLSMILLLPTVYLIKKLKINITDILESSIIMVILSGTIYLISTILSNGDYNENRLPGYEWSLKVGLSMIVFGGATYLLSKLPRKELIQGMIAMVLLSPVILLSSLMLSMGDYSKYPSIDWVLGAGLSIVAFGAAAIGLGFLMLTGVGALALLAGSGAILGIAGLMVGVSSILKGGKWSGYPPMEWSKSVGTSLVLFPLAMMLAAPAVGLSSLFNMFSKKPPLETIAQSMIDVAKILNGFNWNNAKHPTIEWAGGVGLALSVFAAMDLIAGGYQIMGKVMSWLGASSDPLEDLSDRMVNVAKKMDDPIWSKDLKYPKKEWAEGVGLSLSKFAGMSLIVSGSSVIGNLMNWLGGSDDPFGDLVESMINVAKKMDDPIWSTDLKYPKKEWSEGVGSGLFAFANTFKLLNDADIDSDEFGEESIMLIDGLKGIVDKMGGYDWGKLPDLSNIEKWAIDTTSGIRVFIDLIKYIDDAEYGSSDRKGMGYVLDFILDASNKLEGVKFNNIIPIEWSNDTSMGIKSFVDLIKYIDDAEYGSTDIKGLEYLLSTIIDISGELEGVKFNNIIPIEWSNDTVMGIKSFVELIKYIDESKYERDDRKGLEYLLSTIIDMSGELEGVKWNSIDENWADSIKIAVDTITNISPNLLNNTDIIVNSFNKLSKSSDGIKELAKSLREVAESLNYIDVDVMDNLSKFSGSMLVLSLVDDVKLNEFIDVIQDRKDDIKDIVSFGNMKSQSLPVYGVEIDKPLKDNKESERKTQDEKIDKLITHIESIDNQLSEMLQISHMDSPAAVL